MWFFFTFAGISKRVAFSASISEHFTSQNEQTLVFPKVLSNVGGAYNNQDGVFTVPISGTYVFFCKITQGSNRKDMLFQFTQNGSAMTNTWYMEGQTKHTEHHQT